MNPRYALCRGGAHDNERWPLERNASPGYTFAWDDLGRRVRYAVVPEIVETNSAPMWVATPTAA